MREFEIVERRRSGALVVAVRGELDLSRAARVRSALEDAEPNGQGVVVDLTECAFVDSTGVSAIVAASRSLEAAGIAVTIASPRGSNVRRILDLTGVSQAVATFDNVEEAAGRARGSS